MDIDNLRGLKANNAGSVSTFKASKTCTFANASPIPIKEILSIECPCKWKYKIWSVISSEVKLRFKPISPVAQNLQPKLQPHCDDIQNDSQPALYFIFTVSIFSSPEIPNKTFETCVDCCAFKGTIFKIDSPNSSINISLSDLGRTVISLKLFILPGNIAFVICFIL